MRENIVQIMIVVIAAALIGVGSSYVTSLNTTHINTNEMRHVSQDIIELKAMVLIVNDNQIKAATTQEQLKSLERRLDSFERQLISVEGKTTDRYTRQEAKKDFDFLLQQVKSNHK